MMDKKNQYFKLITGFIFLVLIVVIIVKYIPDNKNQPVPAKTNQPVQNQSPAVVASNTNISNSPYLGDKTKAKVAIVEFSDFECPYCKVFFEQSFNQVKTAVVDSGQAIFVYRNFPLDFHNPAAETEANAALCTQNLKDNSAYFAMAHLIYENTGLEGKGITNDNLVKFAGSLGVDATKFQTCLTSDQFKDQISADMTAGTAAGVTGTPSFVIGKLSSSGNVAGELLVGAQSATQVQTLVTKYSK
jgi:protein-disulfide isomerase